MFSTEISLGFLWINFFFLFQCYNWFPLRAFFFQERGLIVALGTHLYASVLWRFGIFFGDLWPVKETCHCLCRWRCQKSVRHLLFTCWSCTFNSFKMRLLIQIKHVHFLIKLLWYLSRAAWHFLWKIKQTFNTWSSVTAAQSSSVLMLIWLFLSMSR